MLLFICTKHIHEEKKTHTQKTIIYILVTYLPIRYTYIPVMVNLIVPDDDSKVERDILSTVPTTILYLLIGR